MDNTRVKNYLKNRHEEHVSKFGHLILTEQIANKIAINSDMRILDIGCGTAISSLYLAEEYDATVIAHDLWVPACENFKKISEFRLEHKVIPIHGDAHQIPFAKGYFDVIFSVDPYHYFISSENYLDYLLRFIKKDGLICIAGPVKSEQDITTGRLEMFYSMEWWENYWQQPGISIISQESSSYRIDDEDIEVNSIIVKKVAEKN